MHRGYDRCKKTYVNDILIQVSSASFISRLMIIASSETGLFVIFLTRMLTRMMMMITMMMMGMANVVTEGWW